MVQHGQHAVGAVVVSWRRTYSGSMVTSVTRTERVGGSRFVTNVWRFWRSWIIIFHDTAISPDSAPYHQK
jgi:hypothetical protein